MPWNWSIRSRRLKAPGPGDADAPCLEPCFPSRFTLRSFSCAGEHGKSGWGKGGEWRGKDELISLVQVPVILPAWRSGVRAPGFGGN